MSSILSLTPAPGGVSECTSASAVWSPKVAVSLPLMSASFAETVKVQMAMPSAGSFDDNPPSGAASLWWDSASRHLFHISYLTEPRRRFRLKPFGSVSDPALDTPPSPADSRRLLGSQGERSMRIIIAADHRPDLDRLSQPGGIRCRNQPAIPEHLTKVWEIGKWREPCARVGLAARDRGSVSRPEERIGHGEAPSLAEHPLQAQ